MAVLDRAKLTADRKTYANRALRYRGAVQVKSPVSDYPEEPNETHYRLLLADTRFGRLATINKAERLLDKFLADDRTNPRRRDEDGSVEDGEVGDSARVVDGSVAGVFTISGGGK